VINFDNFGIDAEGQERVGPVFNREIILYRPQTIGEFNRMACFLGDVILNQLQIDLKEFSIVVVSLLISLLNTSDRLRSAS